MASVRIRRTEQLGLAPIGLAPGELAVEMAGAWPRLWVGVPSAIDIAGRRLISDSGLFLPLTGGTLYRPGASDPLIIEADQGQSARIHYVLRPGAGPVPAGIEWQAGVRQLDGDFVVTVPGMGFSHLLIDPAGLVSMRAATVYNGASDPLRIETDAGQYARVQYLIRGLNRNWSAGVDPNSIPAGAFGIFDETAQALRVSIDTNGVMRLHAGGWVDAGEFGVAAALVARTTGGVEVHNGFDVISGRAGFAAALDFYNGWGGARTGWIDCTNGAASFESLWMAGQPGIQWTHASGDTLRIYNDGNAHIEGSSHLWLNSAAAPGSAVWVRSRMDIGAAVSDALTISNGVGGNVLTISGNNVVATAFPSIRSDGSNIVINPADNGGAVYLANDVRGTIWVDGVGLRNDDAGSLLIANASLRTPYNVTAGGTVEGFNVIANDIFWVNDRVTGAAERWGWYASGGTMRLHANGVGDRMTISHLDAAHFYSVPVICHGGAFQVLNETAGGQVDCRFFAVNEHVNLHLSSNYGAQLWGIGTNPQGSLYLSDHSGGPAAWAPCLSITSNRNTTVHYALTVAQGLYVYAGTTASRGPGVTLWDGVLLSAEAQPYPAGLAEILALEPRTELIEIEADPETGRAAKIMRAHGFAAAAIEAMPEFRIEGAEPEMVNYSPLLPAMVNAIKELAAQIEELRAAR